MGNIGLKNTVEIPIFVHFQSRGREQRRGPVLTLLTESGDSVSLHRAVRVSNP